MDWVVYCFGDDHSQINTLGFVVIMHVSFDSDVVGQPGDERELTFLEGWSSKGNTHFLHVGIDEETFDLWLGVDMFFLQLFFNLV